MSLAPDYQPEFESLAERLLEVAQIRSLDGLLDTVVRRLTERPHVVLARVWLLGRGDRCEECCQRAKCSDRSLCLRLMASAGAVAKDARAEWSHLDGAFCRMPIGMGNAGQVVSRGKQVVINDAAPDFACFARPDWAREQGIRGFNGQPIVYKDEILGVLAVYTRIPTPPRSPIWLRIFADHIAAAIVNVRAFEEIAQLKARLEQENASLREAVGQADGYGAIIGRSIAIQSLVHRIEQVAPTDATALILGESGVGKELVARELHRRSARFSGPLVRVNCASVPRELFESEFFGHVKGAFTGAARDRIGRFEAANGGTLFLDEVGEIPLELQSKFLRVIQERQYERVGEERTREADVRIVAASNRDLEGEVAAGRFRADLFYRLNVVPIRVPALRERIEDIGLLAEHFVEQMALKLGKPRPSISPDELARLETYGWPGNIRELMNVVERALILNSSASEVRFDLPVPPSGEAPAIIQIKDGAGLSFVTESERRARDRANLISALEACSWRIHGRSGAARRLGIKPSTLTSRLKRLGIHRPSKPAS